MRLLAQHSPGFDPATPWVELETHLARETRLFQHFLMRRRSPHTELEHDFTRLHCPEWVNVMAFTAPAQGGELLLVEQFRHGIDASTLEIIGGVCDPGEDPAVTARRELLEETGHSAGQLVPLGSCAPNPAVQDNRCHFFLAQDCLQVAELALDPSEELRVWAATWNEAEDLLRSGRMDHALVMAAFLRLFLWPGWAALRGSLGAPT
ncbi:MAG: NUDIX hydrolase [Holophaga sp.]|jgi:8-oxo-dGTP pyrophosphatase MutT (NUDIX family)